MATQQRLEQQVHQGKPTQCFMYGLRQQYVHCAGCTVALPPSFDAYCASILVLHYDSLGEVLQKQLY